MTGEDLAAWMEAQGLNIIKAADLFGIGRNTMARYMKEGAPDYIAYACAAIAFGLPKWRKVA